MKKYSFSLLLLGSSLLATSPFDQMRTMIDGMEAMSQEIDRTFKDMNKSVDATVSGKWLVTVNDAANTVTVTIQGLTTKAVNANVDSKKKDMLNISTDEGTISIYAPGKSIQIATRQEYKSITDEKQDISISQSNISRTIGSEINLENARIDYLKDKKELVISFDKKKTGSRSRSVPVNIK